MRAARAIARRELEAADPSRIEMDDGLAMTLRQFERLTGAHRSDYQRVDWLQQAARQPQPPPVRTRSRETVARRALAGYQPSWRERLLGGGAGRRRRMAAKLAQAIAADEAEFHKLHREIESDAARILLARRLLQLDPAAIREAIAGNSKLGELSETMNSVSLALPGGGRIVAVVEALSLEDMPLERASYGGGGRREAMPAEERRRLQLASVCSTALRVGAEFVSVLPLGAIEVVVECETDRGLAPVLQLLMTPSQVAGLDWKCGDAVQLAASLGAYLDWTAEQGFAPIRPTAMSAMGRPLARTA